LSFKQACGSRQGRPFCQHFSESFSCNRQVVGYQLDMLCRKKKRCFSMREAVLFDERSGAFWREKHRFFHV